MGKAKTITEGAWAADPQRFVLHDDESLWHRSWAANPATALSLTQMLGNALSYGFSFVGFTSEVSGRFAMAEFEIKR